MKKRFKRLSRTAFLKESDGYLTVTERGRFVLGDIANKKEQVRIGTGSWVVSTNLSVRR